MPDMVCELSLMDEMLFEKRPPPLIGVLIVAFPLFDKDPPRLISLFGVVGILESLSDEGGLLRRMRRG